MSKQSNVKKLYQQLFRHYIPNKNDDDPIPISLSQNIMRSIRNMPSDNSSVILWNDLFKKFFPIMGTTVVLLLLCWNWQNHQIQQLKTCQSWNIFYEENVNSLDSMEDL